MSNNSLDSLPECFKNNFSLTKLTMLSVTSIIETMKNMGNDFQLLLLTPYGFIKGDLAEPANEDTFLVKVGENSYNVNCSYAITCRNNYLKKLENETDDFKLQIESAHICLKNVTIYSNGVPTHSYSTNEFIVFLNQVIGCSLIPRNLNP